MGDVLRPTRTRCHRVGLVPKGASPSFQRREEGEGSGKVGLEEKREGNCELKKKKLLRKWNQRFQWLRVLAAPPEDLYSVFRSSTYR